MDTEQVEERCSRCQRKNMCALRDLVEKTLPHIEEVLIQKELDLFNRAILVGRALRGTLTSPGFTEDWVSVGAMSRKEAENLPMAIAKENKVNLAILCRACRHFRA